MATYQEVWTCPQSCHSLCLWLECCLLTGSVEVKCVFPIPLTDTRPRRGLPLQLTSEMADRVPVSSVHCQSQPVSVCLSYQGPIEWNILRILGQITSWWNMIKTSKDQFPDSCVSLKCLVGCLTSNPWSYSVIMKKLITQALHHEYFHWMIP